VYRQALASGKARALAVLENWFQNPVWKAALLESPQALKVTAG
jgi:hypothetical protein